MSTVVFKKNKMAAKTNWLMKNDVASALAGALFKYSMPSFPGSMEMVAGQALVISILARVLPSNVNVKVGSLTDVQKSSIVIALLGGVAAAYKKHNPMQGAIGYLAIDLLGSELLAILAMTDGSLLS